MLFVLESILEQRGLNLCAVAAKLDTKPPNVCRQIRALIRDGYLVKGSSNGNGHKCYTLNPNFDWILRAKNGKLTVVGPIPRA